MIDLQAYLENKLRNVISSWERQGDGSLVSFS